MLVHMLMPTMITSILMSLSRHKLACPPAILPACHSARLPFCPPAILPACHSARLPFCPPAILPACLSARLPFCPPAILPACHSACLPFVCARLHACLVSVRACSW
ncbi:unnamed protein product [Closterium sp. NIES-54]